MNVAVRYYSKTGNTQKLAEAIASELNVQAKTVDEPVDANTDILFLGSSVYAAGVADEIKNFITTLDSTIGKVVNFSTAALLPSTYNQVKKLVEDQQITMAEEEFHCRGKFSMMHRKHPDDKDLKEARSFAKRVIEAYK